MTLQPFLDAIGQEVEDVEEECFELFSRDIPSANLGFVDSRATTIDVTIHGNDFTIHQSPTLLSSTRAGGTTGAVLWKITPLFAEWISNPTNSNPFWSSSILHPSSTAVELGCGISGLVALALAPSIGHYIATDQEYVRRLFRANLDENIQTASSSRLGSSSSSSSSRGGPRTHTQNNKQKRGNKPTATAAGTKGTNNITFTPLDWELDAPSTLKETIQTEQLPSSSSSSSSSETPDLGFDLLISCDCIYNESLVAPFVRTCADICRLRPAYVSDSEDAGSRPTVCVIAQQQRSPDVFETWLRETMRYFRVWRVSDEVLGRKLQAGTGYLVHVLLVRGEE
ncbi:hypothetical protein C8Q69DRAFT_465719 [Paecilomyces variotii]|uniref:Diaminohydroxyphosphoribosylamino-pyrimidine deaminase n=1 Tax=Byssochlamys spectabilis TaxID=264951 RepID=A0A443HU76_BYSSP|nr:hypothetical protein C8Q69DRAFT_465719 [Paecilomyces variotii]KAJ9364875.1 hypothetical protein DTO280E4_1170 [Paecilomyces variotii]KAJ9380662.1 hypothetical protein DTO063F5_6624 [Paecilomyces variotii]RWQ95367.1 hypothetical protein C8Q69DRAFT_465719 [Paecilomyces variotii]